MDRSLSEVLAGQMDYLYFPLALDELGTSIAFREIGEETFSVGDAQVRTQFLNHTVLTLGFRISAGGRTVVYAVDHEPFSTNMYRAGVRNPTLADIVHAGDRQHVEFLAGADLVIHDAQYTQAEYPQKRHWGHSTVEYVLDVALAARAKQVVLTHHDPGHDDEFLDALQAHCRDYVRAQGSNLQVCFAREGLEILLAEAADQTVEEVSEQPPSTRPRPARILVADDDPDLVRFIQAVLSKDKYEVLAALDGQETIEVTLRERPDLILLDVMMPKLSGYQVAQRLRQIPEFQDTPIIMFTAKADERDIVSGFELGVNDYIGKPAAPAVLRSRVRRWLMRPEQGPANDDK